MGGDCMRRAKHWPLTMHLWRRYFLTGLKTPVQAWRLVTCTVMMLTQYEGGGRWREVGPATKCHMPGLFDPEHLFYFFIFL